MMIITIYCNYDDYEEEDEEEEDDDSDFEWLGVFSVGYLTGE